MCLWGAGCWGLESFEERLGRGKSGWLYTGSLSLELLLVTRGPQGGVTLRDKVSPRGRRHLLNSPLWFLHGNAQILLLCPDSGVLRSFVRFLLYKIQFSISFSYWSNLPKTLILKIIHFMETV